MVEYGNIIAWHFTCNSQAQSNGDLKGVLLKVKNQRTKEPSAESRLKFDSPFGHFTCKAGGEDTRGTFIDAQVTLCVLPPSALVAPALKLWVKEYSVSGKEENLQYGCGTQLVRNPISIFQLITCLEMQSITSQRSHWCYAETRHFILIIRFVAFW